MNNSLDGYHSGMTTAHSINIPLELVVNTNVTRLICTLPNNRARQTRSHQHDEYNKHQGAQRKDDDYLLSWTGHRFVASKKQQILTIKFIISIAHAQLAS